MKPKNPFFAPGVGHHHPLPPLHHYHCHSLSRCRYPHTTQLVSPGGLTGHFPVTVTAASAPTCSRRSTSCSHSTPSGHNVTAPAPTWLWNDRLNHGVLPEDVANRGKQRRAHAPISMRQTWPLRRTGRTARWCVCGGGGGGGGGRAIVRNGQSQAGKVKNTGRSVRAASVCCCSCNLQGEGAEEGDPTM